MKQQTSQKQKILTYRQSRAVKFYIQGGCKNMYKALKIAGYSEAMCRQPQKVFSSPSVVQALEEKGFKRTSIEKPEEPIAEQFVKQKPNPLTFEILMEAFSCEKNVEIMSKRFEELRRKEIAEAEQKREYERRNIDRSIYDDLQGNVFGEEVSGWY